MTSGGGFCEGTAPSSPADVRAGRAYRAIRVVTRGRWNVKMDESGTTVVASSYAMVTVSKIRTLGPMYFFERSHVSKFSFPFCLVPLRFAFFFIFILTSNGYGGVILNFQKVSNS